MYNINIQFAGKYKFQALKLDDNGNEIQGTKRDLTPWINNIITDSGLNLFGLGYYPLYYITQARVGAGSTAASETDTALEAQIAATTTVQATTTGVSGASPYYGYVRRTFRFPTGAAEGNLSEVGIFGGAGNATCFSRALIVDEFGDPTTITVLEDEVLDVIYEFRSYAPETDVNYGPLNISGVDYSGTIRAANVTIAGLGVGGQHSNSGLWGTDGQYLTFASGNILYYSNNRGQMFSTQTLGTLTGYPSGAVVGTATSITPEAYVSDSFYRDHEFFYDLNDANVAGGLGSLFTLTSFGAFQMSFTPKIDKDATKRLRLNIRVSWNRYAP